MEAEVDLVAEAGQAAAKDRAVEAQVVRDRAAGAQVLQDRVGA